MNKKYDLSVLPVRQQNQAKRTKRDISPVLMDIGRGSCCLIIGRPRSGKSVLCCNLLLNSNMYKDAFDDVVIIGGSLLYDKSMRPVVKKYRASCYDTYNDNIINNLIKYNTSFKQDEDDDENIPHTCVVVDDLIGLRGAEKRGNAISRLSSNYRHFGIKMLMFLTQKLTSIPRTIRVCSSDVILYRCDNIGERKQIIEQWGDSYGGEKNLLKLMNQAWDKKYNFLYLKLEDDEGATAYKNFDKKIWSPKQYEADEITMEDINNLKQNNEENNI